MGIALTLQQYLSDNGITYDSLVHERTGTSVRSAEASHVPTDSLAKAVVLKRREGYTVAVVPASRHLELDEVGGLLQQPVGLATEDEIASLFPDCEPGAVPPIAAAYGIGAVVDESLEAQPEIYFEGGDHRTLVHVSGAQFHKLMEKTPHGRFCAAENRRPSKSDTTPTGLDYPYWEYDI